MLSKIPISPSEAERRVQVKVVCLFLKSQDGENGLSAATWLGSVSILDGHCGEAKTKKMRLLTHNMLSSNITGIANGFPLRIEVKEVIEKQVDFNSEFLKSMFPKVEWKALVEASRSMGYAELPEESPESSMLDSDEFLRKFHHALLELHLEEGALVCPETGRKFPVKKGIPNMLLHEDEV